MKPANVLLSGVAGEERAYLTDFGLTKDSSSQSGLVRNGGGQGFAVLGGGSDAKTVRTVTRRMAMELAPGYPDTAAPGRRARPRRRQGRSGSTQRSPENREKSVSLE